MIEFVCKSDLICNFPTTIHIFRALFVSISFVGLLLPQSLGRYPFNTHYLVAHIVLQIVYKSNCSLNT